MRKLHIKKTQISPEIMLNPDENLFFIRGNSAPEDVRALYYPVIEWLKIFVDDVRDGEIKKFNAENPVRLHLDLSYFNSSSAKFLYDILLELKRLRELNIPFITEWMYEEEDIDMKEAGADISSLAEVEFAFIPKHKI
jgi:hypothetical protein